MYMFRFLFNFPNIIITSCNYKFLQVFIQLYYTYIYVSSVENSQETIGHRTVADDYWSMAQYSALGTIFLLCPTHPFSVPFLPFFAAFAPHSRGSGIKRGQGERIKSKGEGSDAASVSAHQGVFNCTHTHTHKLAWLMGRVETTRRVPG